MNRTIHSGILLALFALAIVLFTLGFSRTGSAQATEAVIENFAGNSHTVNSTARLARDVAGNLYGISGGGVFRLSPQQNGGWKQTILYTFDDCCRSVDGGNQPSTVILDAAGNLYGTTLSGGIMNDCYLEGYPVGCGVVFKLTPSATGLWKETVLHAFSGSDGSFLNGSLAFDTAGNL
jgi:hypothetical protein